jgi:hypothetical protein
MSASRILQVNGLATLGCAGAMLAARPVLPPLFGLSSPAVLDIVAVGLLAYGAALLLAARRRPVSREALLAFTVVDVGWVIASAVVLIACWHQLTPIARLLIIGVALIVEVLATLQFRAAGGWMRRSAGATA